INVAPLQVDILDLPSSFIAGESYELKAVVSGGGGASLDGVFVDIGADGGAVRRLQSKTNHNGEVRFTYRAPETPGNYNLAARLDINNPTLVSIEVTALENEQELEADRRFLVEGVTENTESSITTFAGASATVRYPDQTLLTIQ